VVHFCTYLHRTGEPPRHVTPPRPLPPPTVPGRAAAILASLAASGTMHVGQRPTEGAGVTAPMTTRACKDRGCTDLVLVEGEFGYRCWLTGEVPRFNPTGCPKDALSPQIKEEARP